MKRAAAAQANPACCRSSRAPRLLPACGATSALLSLLLLLCLAVPSCSDGDDEDDEEPDDSSDSDFGAGKKKAKAKGRKAAKPPARASRASARKPAQVRGRVLAQRRVKRQQQPQQLKQA